MNLEITTRRDFLFWRLFFRSKGIESEKLKLIEENSKLRNQISMIQRQSVSERGCGSGPNKVRPARASGVCLTKMSGLQDVVTHYVCADTVGRVDLFASKPQAAFSCAVVRDESDESDSDE